MAVLKVLEILADSPKSWEEATANAVAEASKSVRNIRSAHVSSQSVTVTDENAVNGALGIHLEVCLQTSTMRAAGLSPEVISRSHFAEAAYWTIAQLVTHHAMGACQLSAGDLLGTGTLSGRTPDRSGSLLELFHGGKQPTRLNNGEQRTFLQDGDQITLRAHCDKQGYRRIGFGQCTATVLPALIA